MEPKERYAAEFEHRERLRNAVSIPLGVLVVFGGILGSMYRGFVFAPGWLSATFLWFLAVAIYFFLRSAYYLVRSYHGHTYKTIPLAQELAEYREELVRWHLDFGDGAEAAEREFERYLENSLAAAADHNAVVNAAKSEYLFRANASVVYCGILVALSFLPYAVLEKQHPEPVYRVQVVAPDSTFN